ncbi:hypothetical protein IAT38_008038 [Cryptococcus sp. DSM 104549]
MSPSSNSHPASTSNGSTSTPVGSSTNPANPTPNPNPRKARKLNRVYPQLKRKAACLSCRTRRIKCDAGKPHCSSCVRSFNFIARTQPDPERDAKGVQCSYADDAPDPGPELDELQARVARANRGGTGAPEEEAWDSEDEREHGRGWEAREEPRHEPFGEPSRGVKRKSTMEEGDEKDQTIRRLQEEIASLRRTLSDKSAPSTVAPDPSPSGPTQPAFPPSMFNPGDPNLWAGPLQSPLDMNNNISSASTSSIPSDPPPRSYDLDIPNFLQMQQGIQPQDAVPGEAQGPGGGTMDAPLSAPSHGLDEEASKVGGPFLDLLWPGWPPTLPTPSMVDHLVEVFFTMVPSVPRVINRQEFLRRLALPPTHAEFPHRALIHAICAAASMYTAAVYVRSVFEGLKTATAGSERAKGKGLDWNATDESCFSERNALYAKQFIKFKHINSRSMFDLLHTMLVLSQWSQSNSRWTDGWMMIGTATRLAVCLGLLDHDTPPGHGPQIQRAILGPPKDDLEREERRAAMYYLLAFDATMSASSGWTSTLPVDEMSARLPASRADFDLGGNIPSNPQSYHSPGLFREHPVVDSFVMMLKGQILLGRVAKFVRRARRMETEERVFLKETPEFRRLDGDVAAISLSFPASLRDPVQYMQGYSKRMDPDLVSAHFVPRVASILLHEPFADFSNPTCSSVARLLTDARACLSVVYLIISSNADISRMVTPITSCNYLFTATRALLLFYQRALESGDHQGAMSTNAEISVFVLAFSALASRFSMAARHLMMLDLMKRHIEEEVLGHALPDGEITVQNSPDRGCNPPPHTFPVIPSAQTTVIHGFVSYEGRTGAPLTHPDWIMMGELKKARDKALADSLANRVSVHALLDAKRGFVGSPSRGSSRTGSWGEHDNLGQGVAGNQPRWLDMSRSGAESASVMMLGNGGMESGGSIG